MSRVNKSNYQKFVSTQEEKRDNYNNYNNYDIANYNINQQNTKKENYESVLNMFRNFPPRENSVYPFYLFAFPNHPCTIWLRSSIANTLWGLELFKHLCKEYSYRYNKVRDLEKVYEWLVENYPLHLINESLPTKPAQAMPETYMNENSVIAYRSYYMGDKRHIAKWKKREQPSWWV